jgi:hypothetical protein
MTQEEFQEKFLRTTNSLRARLGERLLTAKDLDQIGAVVEPCGCGKKTCPGWAVKLLSSEQMEERDHEDDEEEFQIAILRDKHSIVMQFGKPTSYIELPPDVAAQIARTILSMEHGPREEAPGGIH